MTIAKKTQSKSKSKAKTTLKTKERILQAAVQVLIDKGVNALTLDAVAKQAEVSKGGLLYYFSNKNALIVELGKQLLQDFETSLEQEFEQDDAPNTAGQFLRAYVRATAQMSQESLALFARLSSVMVEMPTELEQSMKAYEKRWQERLENDGLDPVQATIVQLAIDGLWFSEVFQMAVPTEKRRTQVIEALLKMTRTSS